MWSIVDKPFPLHTGVIGATSFTGTGANDLVVSGVPYFAASRQYRVEIDSTSQTFRWSNDNGSTWEEEDVPIANITSGQSYPLQNAEGETEGIKLAFTGGATGHVNGDFWTFTTTGSVVGDTETAVGSVITNGGSAEGLIISGEYNKGAEDGLNLYLKLPRQFGSSNPNRIGRNLDIGDGGLLFKEEYFQMGATAKYTYRVNLLGVQHYKLFQIKKSGAAATGLFTAFATTYKILR